MKIPLKFKGETLILSNEEENGWIGRERGYSFSDLSLEIDLTILCEITSEELLLIQNFMKNNAEIQMRAECHKRNELEKQREKEREEKAVLHRERKKEKKNKVGYVYLVGADNGFYKIGRTVNVTNRVTEFGIKIPMRTWLEHSFSSEQYDTAEIKLHELFSQKRDHGEWFNLSPEDVEYIKSIKDGEL